MMPCEDKSETPTRYPHIFVTSPVEEIAKTTTRQKLHIISGPFARFLPTRPSSFGLNYLSAYYLRMDLCSELEKTSYSLFFVSGTIATLTTILL